MSMNRRGSSNPTSCTRARGLGCFQSTMRSMEAISSPSTPRFDSEKTRRRGITGERASTVNTWTHGAGRRPSCLRFESLVGSPSSCLRFSTPRPEAVTTRPCSRHSSRRTMHHTASHGPISRRTSDTCVGGRCSTTRAHRRFAETPSTIP